MRAEDLYQAIGEAKLEYLEETECMKSVHSLRVVPRGVLIAAIVVVLCAIAALAISIPLREAARVDMGVSAETPIPEWKEYNDIEKIGEEKKDVQVSLLATMCSGDQLYAYIAVSPIQERLAAILADNTSPLYEWDLGGTNTKNCSYFVEQTSYDSETQTALVKVSVRGEELEQLGQVELKLALTHNLKEEATYGPVVIPVTSSQTISCLTDVPVENTKAHFESAWGSRPEALNIPDYSLTGKISRIAICAGYIEVELETPSLEQWVTASNANQIDIEDISDAPFDMKEWFVKRMFCGSWQVGVNEILQGATLNYKDGTFAVIDELPSPYAGVWTIMEGATADSVYAGRQTYRFTPKQAFDLGEIKSITICDTEYSFINDITHTKGTPDDEMGFVIEHYTEDPNTVFCSKMFDYYGNLRNMPGAASGSHVGGSWDWKLEYSNGTDVAKQGKCKMSFTLDGETKVLFEAGIIWNAYLADLDGDGCKELCATVGEGADYADTSVIVCNLLDQKTYTLAQSSYNYALTPGKSERGFSYLKITRMNNPDDGTRQVGKLTMDTDGSLRMSDIETLK